MNKFYKFEFYCTKCRAKAYSDYESTRLCHDCENKKKQSNRKIPARYKRTEEHGDYYLPD